MHHKPLIIACLGIGHLQQGSNLSMMHQHVHAAPAFTGNAIDMQPQMMLRHRQHTGSRYCCTHSVQKVKMTHLVPFQGLAGPCIQLLCSKAHARSLQTNVVTVYWIIKLSNAILPCSKTSHSPDSQPQRTKDGVSLGFGYGVVPFSA
jgi:hypothetical protein